MTYRVEASADLGRWGLTIVREATEYPRWAGTEPQEVEPDAELVAVVVNGDQNLAERIAWLLNASAEGFWRWCENETGGKCDGLEALESPREPNVNEDACTHVGLHNCRGEWRNHDHEQQAAAGTLGLTDHTPDVDYARGAAEALADVRRQLTTWADLADNHEWMSHSIVGGMLRTTAARLGVTEDDPSARTSSTQAAEQP